MSSLLQLALKNLSISNNVDFSKQKIQSLLNNTTLLIEPPKRLSLTGEKHFGPGNTVSAFNDSATDAADTASRRHDLDVTAALTIKNPLLRKELLAKADQKFLDTMSKHYANAKTDFKHYLASRIFKTGLQNLYYKSIS